MRRAFGIPCLNLTSVFFTQLIGITFGRAACQEPMETCARCALETVRWKGLECLADVLQVITNVTMAIWEHSGKLFVRVRNAEQ